jgi:prepilin-type N-terminal cleavage/methylation domain-containing protein
MNKQNGFGLIELIIVIVIIAVLTTFIISKTQNGSKPITQYSQDSKEVAVKTELGSLKIAFDAKLAESGTVSGACDLAPDYTNDVSLKNISNSLKGMGYSFTCQESEENSNCSGVDWYAVACGADNACFCADSTGGGVMSGDYAQFLNPSKGSGPRNCACR